MPKIELLKTNFYQGCAGNINPDALHEVNWSAREYLMEEKYDGIWVAIIYNGTKVVLKSRTEQEKNNEQLKSLKDYIYNFLYDKGYHNAVITGELAFGSQKGTAWAVAHGHHKVDVFDILILDGEEKWHNNLRDRKLLLKDVLEGVDSSYMNMAGYKVAKDYATVKIYFDNIVLGGGEGIIIKDTYPDKYRFGGKSPYWYKVKKEVTMDYVFMGIEISKSETYRKKGFCGGILLGLYVNHKLVHKLTVGSMADSWREEFMLFEDLYIGKVIECKGFEVFKSGALRHPSFLRVRDDKSAIDCTWEV